MRLWLAVVGVGLVGVVGVLAAAVALNRDTVPGTVADCARDAGASVVRSNDTLGRLRADLQAGTVRQGRPFAVGERRALLLEGRGYRILVLAGRGSAPLDRGTARRVFSATDRYAVVAVERRPLRVLEDCARIAS